MKILQILYSILTSIFISLKTDDEEPVRLQKQELKKPKKKKNRLKTFKTILPYILLLIGLSTILLFIVILIYQTGSLESTNYYYRLK